MSTYIKQTYAKTLSMISSCDNKDQLTTTQKWCMLLLDRWREDIATDVNRCYNTRDIKKLYKRLLKLIQHRYVELSIRDTTL